MATIRGYMGVSVDGYIAAADGGIDWLRKYDAVDLGARAYDRFIAKIGTVVMGRATYDAITTLGIGWPYGAQRALVVTSRPLEDPIGPLELRGGDIAALVAECRAFSDGGHPTFPPNGFARSIRLAAAEPLAAGIVWLDYRFDPLTPPGGAGSP